MCSFLTSLVQENCFWPGKTSKRLIFLWCIQVIDLVKTFCVDTNAENQIEIHLYCIELVITFASFIGLRFFSCRWRFGLTLCRIAVLRKVIVLDSKTVLTTNGLILNFGWKCPVFSTSYLHWLKIARIAQMLLSFDDNKPFWQIVWRVFWTVL